MAVLPIQREVFRLESETSQHVIHGNAFTAALGEPGPTLVEAAAVRFGEFIILVVEHDLEQLDHHGELAGAELAEQFMGFGFKRVNSHGVLLGKNGRRGSEKYAPIVYPLMDGEAGQRAYGRIEGPP